MKVFLTIVNTLIKYLLFAVPSYIHLRCVCGTSFKRSLLDEYEFDPFVTSLIVLILNVAVIKTVNIPAEAA